VTTQEEIDEFRRASAAFFGNSQQDGLDFWLESAPEVLKRYRLWADTLRVADPTEPPDRWTPSPVVTTYVAAMTGFHEGVAYGLRNANRVITKQQIFEQLALVFRHAGPRGMATIARAAREHEWRTPERRVTWPNGWAPDPQAFVSGADFTSRAVSGRDIQCIVEWYERWLGEVPKHVMFLARHHPESLKAYRARYENTLRLLPKQTEPWSLLQISMVRGQAAGIREGVLLARGFGMTYEQLIEAINWGTFYGGQHSLGLVDEAAGDIVDSWPGRTREA
jgi:hypothetical protein